MQVAGVPDFLDPEATRQRKVCAAHLQPPTAQREQPAASTSGRPGNDPNFDVAKLAPRLKGTHDVGQAVLSAPAKRSREPKAAHGPYGNAALVRCFKCRLA
jgi:hypothetical protein